MTAFFDSDVVLTFQVKFAANPLSTGSTWTDVSGAVRRFSIRRGRTNQLDKYSAGRLQVTLDNNDGDFDPTSTGSPYSPNVIPMRQCQLKAAYSGTTYSLFYGFVEGWPMSVRGHTDELTTITASDGFKPLTLIRDATTQASELSDVRIGNLLDAAGWPTPWRNISTAGAATVPGYSPDCESVLALIDTVVAAEAGQFYIAANGNATFRHRTYRSGLSPVATFGDKSTELHYSNIETAYDDVQVWNQVEVNIAGFPGVPVDSTASQDKYGVRTLTFNDILLPNATDGDDLAAIYLARYQDPHERIEMIEVMPQNTPATLWPQVLGRDLSDKITVNYRTNAGSTKSAASFIEGIEHRGEVGRQWVTRWTLSQYI